MKIKLVLFSLALAVVAACSGTAPTPEDTASESQAPCPLLPGAFPFYDGKDHAISATVTWSGLFNGQTAPTCSAEFPVGSQPYGTDGVAGCTIGINEYSCYITCPPQTNPPRIKKYIYMCNQSQINLWTWIITDTSNGCFANLNDTILN